MFNDIVYLESIVYQPGQTHNDTLPGTGFLLTADSCVYIVTSKHQVQAALSQQGSIRMSGSYKNKMELVPFDLSGSKTKKPYIVLTDKQDLAILSFKNLRNKRVLDYLLTLGCLPLPVDSLNVTDNEAGGERLFVTSYFSFYSNWVRHILQTLGPGTIKTYLAASNSFLINYPSRVSVSGAPIFKDDKIIGMVNHPVGINSLEDCLKAPDKKSDIAVAVKAKYILQLLKTLQQQEKNSAPTPRIKH